MKRSEANSSKLSSPSSCAVTWNSEPVLVASSMVSTSSNRIASEAEPSISANVARVAATRLRVPSSLVRRSAASTSLSSSPCGTMLG